jgi:hypothetical protein
VRGQIAAHRRDHIDAHAQYLAVLVERHLAVHHPVARLVVAEERFRACALPFDRPSGRLRGEQAGDVFRIGLGFHAEPAADIVGHHMHLLRRYLKDRFGQHAAHGVDPLRAGDQLVAVIVGVPAGGGAARFHRRDGDAVGLERQPGDMGRARERGIGLLGVANAKIEADIVRHVVPDLRRAIGDGVFHVDDCRQGVEIELDQVDRIDCLGGGLRDHQSDDLADMADLADRDRGTRCQNNRRAVIAGERRHVGNIADAGRAQIFPGKNTDDAGRVLGRAHIDRFYRRVGDRRAEKRHIGLPVEGGVVAVITGAGHQALIFAAQHMLGNTEGTSRHRLFSPLN